MTMEQRRGLTSQLSNTKLPDDKAAHSTTSEQKRTVTPLQSLFAGSVAGAVEASITYPFDYIKTRSQLLSSNESRRIVSNNPLRFLAHVCRNEGFGAIYTGCSTLVLGTALKAGVRFLTFDTVKAMLQDDDGKLSPLNGIFAGMLAGAVESVTAVTPTERIKTAMIDDAKGPKVYTSLPHAVRVIYSSQGLRGLYRGLLSTTAKQSATSAVRMGTYSSLKTSYAKWMGRAPKSVLETFSLGACAGVVTVYATQPFDAVKTRAQSARGEILRTAVRSVWQHDGVKGYWRGSTARLGRLVLSGGIVFSVYEQIVAAF
jgi:solute carrier family 25 (mitochondrial citrate transporter), member 1